MIPTWDGPGQSYLHRQGCVVYMHLFNHQSVQQNGDNTQNTVSKEGALAHHHMVIERASKIAYIPEKEYNYLSVHTF